MRQTVFYSQHQLLQLRDLFFGGDTLQQRRALALCRAYETRYRLPVSVHLTALVVAATLADCPAVDLYAIRLGYSGALIRLVNEILDSAQQGKTAAPLHALAVMLDLPSSFVEARHAATHEDLPTVEVLRELVRRAMVWLDEHFWRLQTATQLEQPTKQLLILWRKTPNPQIIETLRTRRDLVEVVLSRIDKLELKRWSPLFEKLDCNKLLVQLLNQLNASDWAGALTTSQERQTQWVEHLVCLCGFSADVLRALSSLPRPWNARGLAAYSQFDPEALAKAQKMARFCSITIETTTKRQKRAKWKTVENWTPRPLGV